MYQSVFISGVSGMLGLSLAKELVDKNLVKNLYVQVRKDIHDAYLLDLVKDRDINLYIEHFDIRDDIKLKSTLKKALSHKGDILVIANAGVSLSKEDGHFLEDDFEIDRAFGVNTCGTVKTLYYALHFFLENISYTSDKSTIDDNDTTLHLVAMSSLASLLPMRSSPLYSASKAAVNYYIKALDGSIPKNLKDRVYTTLLLPGFINTAMSQRFIGSKSGMISSDKAAFLMLNKIRQRKKVYAFPWYLHLGIKLSYLLPDFILTHIMKAFDFTVQKDKERYDYEKQGIRYKKDSQG